MGAAMSADLEKRLRDAQMVSVEEGNVTSEPIPICQEAADALSLKDEEIARLNAALDEARAEARRTGDDLDDMAAQRDRIAALATEATERFHAERRKAAEARAAAIEEAAPLREALQAFVGAVRWWRADDHDDGPEIREKFSRAEELATTAIRALATPERAAEEERR